ncbi:IG_like [Nesidiocoris tenuis]|uniref:IG_like n=1 Tax=Nesidiocoris tenuis TaxID=355587 RepID=A0ABN7A9D1_9HEMI|nr:IG_like [Nesidiocoris tenuis]
MMNGEPSTGSRHSHQQHSHTHHGSRARRKHHRRQQQENTDSLHRYNRQPTGSAPASPPPSQHRCYTSPDSPPSANSYSANPSAPHYSTYTAPRSKADYTFIKFHDPYRPQYPDMEYADVDYRSYGPINYKAASISNAQQKQEEEELL